VKLLFDENLAASLVDSLSDSYNESVHVRDVGLKSSADRKVWDYAAEMGYTIVTKDADFRQRSFLFGPPPKVIWIGLGNCSTKQIAELLRKQRGQIEAFGLAEDEAFLSLRH
jgi:predicted nuclease of predicted toxin-antitoxin system